MSFIFLELLQIFGSNSLNLEIINEAFCKSQKLFIIL